MPINLRSLGAPDPDEVAPDGTALGQSGGAPAEEPDKPKRRSKAQMIADAVVPGMDDVVMVKDVSSGAKVERPWRVAVEMVRDGKAEWPDNALKYAFMKYEQQRAQGAFAPDPSAQIPSSQHLESGKKGDQNVPPEAEVGDEVIVGSETYRLGHGRVLTHGVIGNPDGSIIHAKRRWQRELGSGVNGPWASTPISLLNDDAADKMAAAMDEDAMKTLASDVPAAHNGSGATVTSQRMPLDVERVGLLEWKIGTGILNKIGLPDYSQLQIGPINASRLVLDDGRRTTVMLGDRQAQIPTVVIEGFAEVCDTVEYVARYQRGQLVSFLESLGALRQPVSS